MITRSFSNAADLFLLALIASAAAPGAEPIVIDSHRQLFLDDYLVASMTHVKRSVEQAQKFSGNPVLWPSEAWEPPMATLYGSVLREGDKFRMWYKSGMGVGYAESGDGIRWTRPLLDQTLVKGERSNILFTKKSKTQGPAGMPYFYELFGVHRDDRDPNPERRYKMGYLEIEWNHKGTMADPFHKTQRRGLGVAASPDGIHWQEVGTWASQAIIDGATHWMWDDSRGKYVLYGRTRKALPEVAAAWATNAWYSNWFSGRAVARIESADFLKWDFTGYNTAPVALTADLQDAPGTEIYSMKVFPYEGLYVGLIQVFHATPDDATLDVQLAVSRDSLHFTRVGDRSAFIALGGNGSWDRFNLSIANNDPIAMGDDLRFYYGGRMYRHSPYAGPDKGPEKSGIGFATIKRDRFAALEASFDGGEVLTKPLVLPGNELYLNAKADFGAIIVEVLDIDGRQVGLSEPVRQDAVDIPIRWKRAPEAGQRPVQLRFKLENARLFAFWSRPSAR